MSNTVQQLSAKFRQDCKYANFGSLINSISIDGFRGISGLTIEPSFPVVAFSGLNGSGKSTIGQLMACGYRKPANAADYRRFYVKDFFPLSDLDPAPFDPAARVMFTYEAQGGTSQSVTISRATTEWSGYKRQPERRCYYVGFTLYLPKVERRDLSIYRASTLTLTASRDLDPVAATWVSQILNQSYEGLKFQGVAHGTKTSELAVAERLGRKYSENHMGFGEGRVFYMVSLMENAPDRSLFVLEEPETSLHEEAQYRLASYLLEVCNRKHHQIVMSTHSSTIMSALPPQSRVYISRDTEGVQAFPGLSATHVRSFLSGGFERSLTIAVEDAFAAKMLEQIIRDTDQALLSVVKIIELGSSDAVASGVKLLKKAGQNVIGVRDADMPERPADSIFKLPGAKAPECDVFESPKVSQAIKKDFGLDIVEHLAANPVADHHLLPSSLAAAAKTDEANLTWCALRAYVDSLSPEVKRALVDAIREHC